MILHLNSRIGETIEKKMRKIVFYFLFPDKNVTNDNYRSQNTGNELCSVTEIQLVEISHS